MRIGFHHATLAVALSATALVAFAARAEVESGVIRLAEPSAPDPSAEDTSALTPLSDARRGFDVEAFDGRLESLWFQRKAYHAQGREEDATRQTEMIGDFVAEEGVRRLELPAGALVLEAEAWRREGSHEKALASLSLAEALDPGRPQIFLARARVLWASGAGALDSTAELARGVRAALALALHDLHFAHEGALVAVFALMGSIGLFGVLMAVRHQVALRHDVEEWLVARYRDSWARAGGWAVLLLPFIVWIGAGWAAIYWLVVTFRYMRRGERALTVVLLACAAALVPCYRFSVGLYGLAADPTVRTTIDAANGGYDPDRIVKLRELVQAHPDDPMYRFLLAGLLKNGRYFEEAFEEYRSVLEVAPSTYQARINLGNIHFLVGQYGEAISNYNKALALRPDSVLAYYDMYLAQSDSFKLKEATASLAKARDLDPETTNRLLAEGSREGGTPKVVDAVIDFDSIWRATVEGRHLREWLDAGPQARGWTDLVAGLLNPVSIVALLGLTACGVIAGTFRGRVPAQRCVRCGRPFCPACKASRDGHGYCNQCVHLFVLGDGLAPETKSMKLYEVERHESWARRGRRAASLVLPGSSQLLAGRAWLGFGLILLWVLAWVGGFPEAVGPIGRAVGSGVNLAGLRLAPVPSLYGLDAALMLGGVVAAAVWIAGNAGARRPKGA